MWLIYCALDLYTCTFFFYKKIFSRIIKFKMEASNEVYEINDPVTKNVGGRPLSQIWNNFIKGNVVATGKIEAECKYCKSKWKRGELPVMEEHLASHCKDVPATIIREYMGKVEARENTSNKRRKQEHVERNQTNITDFHDSTELPEGRIDQINCALVKFFVCCGISFRVVEHPFFINFLKELNGGYNPPTREYLSTRLLEKELCKVNRNVNDDIKNQSNLTLDK